METADSHQNASSAVTLPIDDGCLEQGDVDSKMQRSTPLTRTMPGTRTSTMATRITTTRATKCVPALSADYSERDHADFLNKNILDPCSGSRMFWFDRQHANAIFGDNRIENHVLCDGRALRIEPDVLMDFTDMPFDDGSFKLVVFDPPHLHTAGSKGWMAKKYGKLSATWQEDLRKGFAECFRVLEPSGILVFKWNETQVKVREVLALTDIQPLFGNTSGKKSGTHWYVFMKTVYE